MDMFVTVMLGIGAVEFAMTAGRDLTRGDVVTAAINVIFAGAFVVALTL